jgi:hypothetical protein
MKLHVVVVDHHNDSLEHLRANLKDHQSKLLGQCISVVTDESKAEKEPTSLTTLRLRMLCGGTTVPPLEAFASCMAALSDAVMQPQFSIDYVTKELEKEIGMPVGQEQKYAALLVQDAIFQEPLQSMVDKLGAAPFSSAEDDRSFSEAFFRSLGDLQRYSEVKETLCAASVSDEHKAVLQKLRTSFDEVFTAGSDVEIDTRDGHFLFRAVNAPSATFKRIVNLLVEEQCGAAGYSGALFSQSAVFGVRFRPCLQVRPPLHMINEDGKAFIKGLLEYYDPVPEGALETLRGVGGLYVPVVASFKLAKKFGKDGQTYFAQALGTKRKFREC